jgi:pimeloyl-ACP methyl ester carboxylesterase
LPTDLYILSGLGADERVFQRLDLSGYSVTFIKWQAPLKKETIGSYAARLLAQIKTPKPTLIGLSFGGIMAVEIAKQIDTEKIILISAAKTKNEIPFYYRWAGVLKLHTLLPKPLLKSSNFLTNWLFGVTSSDDKQLLKQTLKETDIIFLKWAINAVVHWKNQILPKKLFHIHGKKDRILPVKFLNCDRAVKTGGHLMILNKADELSVILKEQLGS